MAEKVGRMHKANIFEPATAKRALAVVVVHKHNESFRTCSNYRKLNAVTICDLYPPPQMDECINSLGDATVLLTLEAIWGYRQMTVAGEDKDRATSTSHRGSVPVQPNALWAFECTCDVPESFGHNVQQIYVEVLPCLFG